jgi:hypothetical protein
MFTTSILSAGLEKHTLLDNMPDRTDEFENVRIMDGSMPLDPRHLNIGEADAFYDAARKGWNKDSVCTVVIAGGGSLMDYYLEQPSLHIIITDLPLIPVVNSINELADEYSRMSSLWRHLRSSVSVSDPVIEGAAKAMNADIFYLSSRLRVISLCREIECGDFLDLEKGVIMDPTIVAGLKDEWTHRGDYVIRMTPIELDGIIQSYLLVILHNNSRERFNSDMLGLLRSNMEDFTRLSFADRSLANDRFTTLATDIISGKIKDTETLRERTMRTPNVIKGQYFMILMECEKLTDRMPSEIIPLVTSILRNVYPIQYDNKLALLIQREKYEKNLMSELRPLEHILDEYKLYACVGNMARNLLSLKADYDKLSKCLIFARTFCPDKKKRGFYAEEYAMYNVVDICCNAVSDEFHAEYVKLCCPGALTLRYYDDKNGTNNAQLLRDYLLNGENLTETALQHGIHRNTLTYRLGKIREMIGEDLSMPLMRFRMMFSLVTLDYLDSYRNRQVLYDPYESDIN